MKAGCCLIFVALLAGCTANPFVNRTIETAAGEPVRYSFAYGRYCGPDRPFATAPDTPDELLDFWPPVDDIDAMCFAHDYCHGERFASFKDCDLAMAQTIQHFRPLFRRQACFNLSSDMLSVMHELAVSVWPNQDVREMTAVVNAVVYAPISGRSSGKTDEYPDEGDCRMVTGSSVTMVLDAFEYFYQAYNGPVGKEPTGEPINFEIPRGRIQ